MHALLVSFGTDGDVYPFIALGIELRSRGHRVTLAANEHYGALAASHGFGFCALITNEKTQALMQNPDVWHPIKSALVGARWGREGLGRQYELLEQAARDPETVIVAYPPVFVAKIVHEKLACPLVSLVPMPWMILSDTAPPALPAAMRFPRLQSPGVARMVWRAGELATDLLMGGRLNDVRKSIGLKPIRGIYRWCFSRQLVIGLFPEWYAPPQNDWPLNTRLAGFSLFDGGKPKTLPDDLLPFCREGTPPVVFTFGTGMMHGRDFFAAAMECCQILDRRGIFLTKHRDQLPGALPPSIRQWPYAPFSQLFPVCAAVVHHGGAGTTAQALAAGLPQLILPLAWDQPDNATRVKRLGVGDSLSPKSSGAQMANALTKLWTPDVQSRCREVAGRFNDGNALARAADWVEQLAREAMAGKGEIRPRPKLRARS